VSDFLSSLLAKALMSILQTILTELTAMIVRTAYARYGMAAPARAF
jgi:hypothetical protein